MDIFSLLMLCMTSFIAVFVVLSILSLFIKLVVQLFPDQSKDDSAIIAAISSTTSSRFPGMKVTKIEEIL